MVKKEVEKLLKKVQKPARYTGGELNSVIKNKEDVKLRYAFCFPDNYEIGMSHLGMKILYRPAILGSILGLVRSPGEGHGNPLQYSYLKNPMDKGAWWATVHGIAKSWT